MKTAISTRTMPLRIWIDADACPKAVKEIIYKASQRLQVPVSVVANSPIAVPRSTLITMVKVEKGADVADHYICAAFEPHDLVITADIPLAGDIVAKGGIAINPRGEVYTKESIGEHLSRRNFMDQMRSSGMQNLGGPSEFTRTDVQRFAAAFDRLLSKKIKEISLLGPR